MKLRTKFSFLITVLIIAVSTALSVSIFLYQKNMLIKEMETQRMKIFTNLENIAEESLVVGDELLLLSSIKSVKKNNEPFIRYVMFISPKEKGRIFKAVENEIVDAIAESRKDEVSDFKADRFFTPSPGAEEIFEIAKPVIINNNYSGTLKTGFSQKQLNLKVEKEIAIARAKILKITLFCLIIGLLLSQILAYKLVGPIKRLELSAIEISKGNLDERVHISTKDEIGKLGETFNMMGVKLKELDQLKDDFVSSVSHELRSPLSAIDGYCDFMLDNEGLNPEKRHKALRIIKDSTVRLTNFINDILNIAKIKAGKYEIRMVPSHLSEIVTEVVNLVISLAQKKSITFTADIMPHLPMVNVDPEKIKQVLTNLICNSIKFTPEGGEITVSAAVADLSVVSVDLSASRLTSGQKFVQVSISDTGPGMAQEELTKIFDKFHQIKQVGESQSKGTGLGLAIVQEIIKLHNSKIWVESQLGKGTTFHFLLQTY